MGLLDWLFGKPRRRRPRRVVLVSPKGRRISFPPSAKAISTLQRRGWRRVS